MFTDPDTSEIRCSICGFSPCRCGYDDEYDEEQDEPIRQGVNEYWNE